MKTPPRPRKRQSAEERVFKALFESTGRGDYDLRHSLYNMHEMRFPRGKILAAIRAALRSRPRKAKKRKGGGK